MIKRTIFLSITIVILFFLSGSALMAQGDYVVIVNKDVAESSLSSEAMRRIYFGFNANWQDNQKIKLSYTDSESPELWKFLSTSQSGYNQYWNKRESSGNGTAPVKMKSGESVIDYVSSTKGAIGIIRIDLAAEIGEDCKLMTISD